MNTTAVAITTIICITILILCRDDRMAHFNSSEARAVQDKYCKENGYPHFAPESGKCWSCNSDIYAQINHGEYKTGISVEEAGSTLITGCPHCHISYCD